MANKADKFNNDPQYRQKVINKLIQDAKENRAKQLDKLRNKIEKTKNKIASLEDKQYKQVWDIVIKDVFEINDSEKKLLINGNIYNFSDVVNFEVVDNYERMKALVQTGYVARHNPSLVGMIAGSEYGLIGTIALGNLLGEDITTIQEVYKDKNVNTYFAIDIKLKNCYETIVLNDKPIENKFSNMSFIILYESRITEGLKLAIKNAFDAPIKIKESEELYILRENLKKWEYEYSVLINKEPEINIPEEYKNPLDNVDYIKEHKENEKVEEIQIKEKKSFGYKFSVFFSILFVICPTVWAINNTGSLSEIIVGYILALLINPISRKWIKNIFTKD